MPYILDTTTLADVLEHTDFSGVVGIVQSDPNIADPPITTITVTRGSQYTLGPNITSNISGNSVTISGQYTDNFTTGGITFLDKDSKSQTVQKFTDVPADFSTVVSYSPSGVSFGDALYTITVNGNIAGNVTQTVINNYSTGRDSLIALVAKGKY
jgi:hypothetical protein